MAVSAAPRTRSPRHIENRHIDHIPAGERHGKPWHQFAFWFGGNVNAFNVVLGAVVVSLGLNFWQALIAVAAGTLIGALLIALHATQGPRLAAEWPFISQPAYTGPLVRILGGADISWLTGWFAAAVAYLLLAALAPGTTRLARQVVPAA